MQNLGIQELIVMVLMVIIALVIAVAVIALILKLLVLPKTKGAQPVTPARMQLAESRKWLLTKHESVLFHLLVRCLPEDMHIHSKVRISDLVLIKKTQGLKVYQSVFAQISQKHVDFVITKGPSEIAFAVELDDATHQQTNRIKRDELVDGVFESAGIPLVHIVGNAANMSPEDILAQLPLTASVS